MNRLAWLTDLLDDLAWRQFSERLENDLAMIRACDRELRVGDPVRLRVQRRFRNLGDPEWVTP